VTAGRGWTYGYELLVERTKGKTTGWLGYTYSHNYRRFAELNNGERFPFKYDRRHNFSIVVIHQINKKTELVASWIFNSGEYTTLPVSRTVGYTAGGSPYDIFVYGNRNNYRYKDNHRLDFSLNFKKKLKRYYRVFSIGLYNAYNRQNPFFITPGYDSDGNYIYKQITIFPIIPSLTYKISL
jgi:hypothetical protein